MKKPSTRHKRKAAKLMKPRRENLAEELHAFRTYTGFTQIETASYLGCDQTQVSRWGCGDLCGVPMVGALLQLGMRASVPLLRATIGLSAPADPLALVARVVKVEDMWKVKPPRTMGRLAAVVSLLNTFEPHAVQRVLTQAERAEQLETAVLFAHMWRQQGNPEKAALWDAKAHVLRGK